MQFSHLSAALHALLFVYGEPLSYKKAAGILQVKEEEIREAVTALHTQLSADEKSGLSLVGNEDEFQLTTKGEFSRLLETVLKAELNEALTPAALETLAIVAYAGPIARSEIDYIRGVNSSFILRSLALRGLVERQQDPKRLNAYQYRASFDLLKHLGIGAVSELPEYDRFRQLVGSLRQSTESVAVIKEENSASAEK